VIDQITQKGIEDMANERLKEDSVIKGVITIPQITNLGNNLQY